MQAWPKSAVVRYAIKAIDPERRAVLVSADLPAAAARSARIVPPRVLPYAPRCIHLPDRGVGSAYEIRFDRLPAEKVVPPVAPRWVGSQVCLPLWSVLPLPPRGVGAVEVTCDRALGRGVELLAPAGPLPAAAFGGFCLLGGYSRRPVNVAGVRATVHCTSVADLPLLAASVERVLSVHARFFGAWMWRDLHLVFEPQLPRLRKQKAMLFSADRFGVGRYVLRSLRPRGRLELVTLLDLVEHEVLHYFLDTTAPAGDWMVEGLTTYCSRKLLFEAGVLTERDWSALVREAFRDLARNPLARKVSLREAPARFWDPRYGNVIYAKGFLVACLVDQELGGTLLGIARELYRRVVSQGRQFAPRELLASLPPQVRRRLARLLAATDLTSELADVRAVQAR